MKNLKNHKKIMLILTESCNLRCVYCYEQTKRAVSMDFKTAKEILDKSYRYMDGYESMVIELHGGEPFINFDLIKRIDEYVMDNYSMYPVLFRCITNGTLVHGDVQKWLAERKDRFEVMLSLDGDKAVHDKNRKYENGKGSFDSIDLNFFRNTWDNCPISMTVNACTLPYLAESTIWMEKLGFYSCNAFEWAVNWDLEKNIPILKAQLDTLVKHYSENTETGISLIVKYSFGQFFKPIEKDFRYCIDIDDPLECYDARGNYAPCHGFTEFTVGSEEIAAKFKDLSIRDFVHTDENICKDCKFVRMCRTCFAANHMLTGNMQLQSNEICIFNCLCIKAGLEIERNRTLKKYTYNDEVKEYFDKLDIIDKYADYVLNEREKI